jgi:hypothetical protein
LAGGLQINGSGKINLQAAAVNNVYPDLDGVLIYDVEARKVQLGGDTTSVFGGALFFRTLILPGTETLPAPITAPRS